MLLSSLSILMGAILVPSDYLWVYSTHIIMVCLYLIWTKRLLPLFLTLVSLIFLAFHESKTSPIISLKSNDTVYIDFQKRTLEPTRLITAELSGKPRYQYRNQAVEIMYFNQNNERRTHSDFVLLIDNQLEQPKRPPSPQRFKGIVTNVLLSDKEGSWWQKKLYINRHIAQITVELSMDDVRLLALSSPSPRDQLLDALDARLSTYNYWRFSKALLLGQNDLWSQKDTWVIRTLGLAHLFVVSGLHTGFMFVIGSLISRAVWQLLPGHLLLSGLTRWHCDAMIIVPLLFAYAYFTNWGEPVVRAAIMLSSYLCARMLAMQFSAYSIITFALWVVLLANPRTVLSPGLWLSFSLVYLLIGYCQTTKLSRLIMGQIMLSTASMVLILGWQEEISSVSVLVNMLMIPFAGFIWFPLGLLSCFEVLLIGSTYSYKFLELLLFCVDEFINWVVFSLPLLTFETFATSAPKALMLLLIVFWVYQSPLKRGVLSILCVWCLLFSSTLFYSSKPDYTILNKNNKLVLKDKEQILMVNAWAGSDIGRLLFDPNVDFNPSGRYLLSPAKLSDLTPRRLLTIDTSWVFLQKMEADKTITMLDALNVNWLIISDGEFLEFHFQDKQLSLRHSSCLYSFFLLKSDTCKRVEKLESVLNYLQT
ncbi:ComEC/Rec2 family competence protein [Marinomonas foliarum]|uniref:Competence protein ComEC n=1 Tax=Marinomonas foliarum TaxID=491950 RepID=A0A368ZZU2_9GAMM|nr:ComEC/Rec2 family competence protein [Marinomonas foliarum]RCX02471.1 competence protein ComEC [Marinomonas foliarum]